MAPTQDKPLRVLIAGAGIGGLSLAIFLTRAKIDYVVLERSASLKTIGGALGLSGQALRVFDQIGIYDELAAVSKPLTSIEYYNQNKEKVGQLDGSLWEKRYGYGNRVFPRNELMKVLLRHVPPENIQWGKSIKSTAQNEEGVSVVCTDATHFVGDVLIGSDGTYSAVRRSLYKNMQEKGQRLGKGDLEHLRFDQFAILGITSDISDEWPTLKEPKGAMEIIVASNGSPYNVYAIPIPGGRLNWMVGCRFHIQPEDQDEFRFSNWDSDSAKAILKEIENLPITIGGTIGNLLDKLFHVWYDGRTCLMGDAVHKTLPAGGQGANQTILDAVCLTNLLYELPSTSTEDINKMFARYREIRFSTAKQAVGDSALVTDMISKQGLYGDLLRAVVLGWMPSFITTRIMDALAGERPLLTFEPAIPDKGEFKNTSKAHTIDGKHMSTI
ncbi:hypothetical protein DFQ27_003304 [Actinomortierella ambigua]|uniref:FAD-binding domain-containing protein n=1 Tax=Actinomortierella ambigua TaxID=1343610 RepID=A0A9P6Q517_9FUNG|nr:hypothetical protein DFQ27_003304 [Actinomortierella ambigua]